MILPKEASSVSRPDERQTNTYLTRLCLVLDCVVSDPRIEQIVANDLVTTAKPDPTEAIMGLLNITVALKITELVVVQVEMIITVVAVVNGVAHIVPCRCDCRHHRPCHVFVFSAFFLRFSDRQSRT